MDAELRGTLEQISEQLEVLITAINQLRSATTGLHLALGARTVRIG